MYKYIFLRYVIYLVFAKICKTGYKMELALRHLIMKLLANTVELSGKIERICSAKDYHDIFTFFAESLWLLLQKFVSYEVIVRAFSYIKWLGRLIFVQCVYHYICQWGSLSHIFKINDTLCILALKQHHIFSRIKHVIYYYIRSIGCKDRLVILVICNDFIREK